MSVERKVQKYQRGNQNSGADNKKTKMKTEKGKQWSKKQQKTQTFRDLANYGNDTRFLNCCKINTKKNPDK